MSEAQVKNDAFFDGLVVIRVGSIPTGRDVVWTGGENQFWGTVIQDMNFVVAGTNTPTFFQTFDHVLFDDQAERREIQIDALVQPGSVTFDRAGAYSVVASDGIAGAGGITKNGSGTLTPGGGNSNFTGAVAVNAERIVMGANGAFGNTSGITVADGASVDINGRNPGSLYTYTISGNGPDGEVALTNIGPGVFSTGTIRHLVLAADASIGGNGNRFDIANDGTITGNGHTLTKIGSNTMGFRGARGGQSDPRRHRRRFGLRAEQRRRVRRFRRTTCHSKRRPCRHPWNPHDPDAGDTPRRGHNL